MQLEDLKITINQMTQNKQIKFLEMFLKNMPTMNRGIWGDDDYSDANKVDCLKWSNELCHRLWNMKLELVANEKMDCGDRFIKQLKFHANQNKDFAAQLGGFMNVLNVK